MAINSQKIISGNHVTDFSSNPTKINSTNQKLQVILLEGGGGKYCVGAKVGGRWYYGLPTADGVESYFGYWMVWR